MQQEGTVCCGWVGGNKADRVTFLRSSTVTSTCFQRLLFKTPTLQITGWHILSCECCELHSVREAARRTKRLCTGEKHASQENCPVMYTDEVVDIQTLADDYRGLGILDDGLSGSSCQSDVKSSKNKQ